MRKLALSDEILLKIEKPHSFYSAYNVHLLWDLIPVPDQNYIFQT